MNPKHPFKWRHFLPEVILLNVRWYCRYALSYRDARGDDARDAVLTLTRASIHRWVQAYAPERRHSSSRANIERRLKRLT